MADQNEPDMVGFQSEADFDRVAAATKYVEGLIRTGNPAWVNPSNGGPVICDVRITGARDGTTHLFPGQQVIPKPKALPAAKTYLDVGKVWVYDLNDADLTNGQKYRGIGAFTYPDGVPVVLVTVGGNGGSDGIDAIVTGGDDASGYSWSEAELVSGVWGTKSGGLSGTTNLFRMPSNIDPEDIPTGQYLRIWPSKSYSGKYECAAPGGMETVSIVLPDSWQINSGSPCTITAATTKTLTITGRDLTVTYS